MATTDFQLACSAIQALRRSGVHLGLLHGATPPTEGHRLGDTDVVVDRPPLEVLGRARKALADLGLMPIMVYFYDNAGSAAIILSDVAAASGVHLDMLYDPRGTGPYGIRSESLLRWVDDGELPVVKVEASLIYLWRKSLVKAQERRLARVSEEAARIGRHRMQTAADSLVGDHRLTDQIMSHRSRHRRRRPPFPSTQRIATRLRSPAGYWVHCCGATPALAREVGQRFAAILPKVTTTALGSGNPSTLIRWAHDVPLTRWRAGLALSTGTWERSIWTPSPDAVLHAQDTDTDTAARYIVRAMSSRFG